MDFYNDIVQIARDVLDHYDVGYADLLDGRQIVERWVNVQLKLIKAVPHEIVKSAHIISQSDPVILGYLQIIENKFRNGTDVNPHQGKGIFREDYTDYLFSDWGIFHLHLSDKLEGKYFMVRSDSLLFVLLHKKTVYFIDVRPHDEQYVFAQKELLKIVYDEWPYVIEPFRLQGVSGLSYELEDPMMIAKMRKAGVNVFHRIGNDFFVPIGGGITTAATSIQVTIQVDKLYFMAKRAMDDIDRNKTNLVNRISEAMGITCTATDFHLELTGNGFFVFDRISKCGFPIKDIQN